MKLLLWGTFKKTRSFGDLLTVLGHKFAHWPRSGVPWTALTRSKVTLLCSTCVMRLIEWLQFISEPFHLQKPFKCRMLPRSFLQT